MPRAVIGLVLSIFAFGPSAASAQQPQPPKEPERLFRSREPLDLTLIAPLQTLFKNRDTIEKKPQQGTLVVPGEGGTLDSVPVTLETRGHFRLRSSNCRFPPIKVIFDKALMKETVFKGQGSLKLSTHCQNRDNYEQNVLVEEAVYRIYNLLTPLSNRTRLARIRYVPTEDTSKVETRYAFFIEDHDEMAKRNHGVIMDVPGYALSDMDPQQLDLVTVFLYMVGNHDWSIYALHNMRIVQTEGYVFGFPVAYDFDFTGLVNAPYAGPPPQLPIRSLRQRLYRGICRDIEELVPTVARVVSARDSILATIAGQPDIEPGTVKDATNYLKDFFDDLKKPEDFKREMGYACRG
jgi:hypothetical protein